MKSDSSKLFWISYADLLTALFVVALALFVFSYRMFLVRQDDLIDERENVRIQESRVG